MTSNPIPENLQTDHLFLLIGTNPLPNYVAAKLLLKKGGQLYLVHSSGTREVTKRLETLLRNEGIISAALKIEVNEADAVDISGKANQMAQSSGSGSIGLNYTGGTKVMAVQCHQAIRDAALEKNLPDPVFSYLDARSYEMKFEPVGTSRPAGHKVLLAVNLDLEDLLTLHEIHLEKKSLERETQLPGSAGLLAQIHANGDAARLWRKWCDDVLRKEAKDNRNNWKSESNLKKIQLQWPNEDELQPIVEHLCKEMGLAQNRTISLAEVKGNPFRKVYHFCRWLDGIWLEQYVYDQIKQIEKDCQINDVAMSLDTVYSKVRPNFEVDVGVMRGYQLFGISCTTSMSTGLTKSKLFEAYLRTSQLGGDEARTALVCPTGDPGKLQKEIDENIPDKVQVFGAQALPNLKEHLAYWFTEADCVR